MSDGLLTGGALGESGYHMAREREHMCTHVSSWPLSFLKKQQDSIIELPP